MTDLKQKRYEAIRMTMIQWGIYRDGFIFMSIWDLAMSLNNIWKAPLFVTKKNKDKLKEHMNNSLALEDWNYSVMFNAIKHGVKDTDIDYIYPDKGMSYFVMLEAPK